MHRKETNLRRFLLFPLLILLAGCASTAASPSPTATPKPKPVPTPFGARFSHAPAMTVNVKHSYTATMVTSKGTFTIKLLPKVAPLAVNSFVFLARHKYYQHIQFFRVISGFMVQTGDPTNTGFGGPGYTFRDEKVTLPYRVGTVAMANSGPNSNGSQFFIVVGMSPSVSQLHGYTIFGAVTKGMNVVEKIANVPVVDNPTGELSQPLSPVWLKSVTIHESH